MTQKIKYLLLSFTLIVSAAQAQKYPYWEVGVFGGLANYHGELSNGLNDIGFWKNAGGLLAKVHLDETVVMRTGINVAKIMGDDALSDYAFRVNRNLNFRSIIYEFNLLTEIHLFTGGQFRDDVSPYIFAGFAGFRFNPEARYQNDWVALQPLGTEGQGTNFRPNVDKYSLIQLSMPTGAGVEFYLGRDLWLAVEFGYRWTLTDFLDDVSGFYPDPNEMEIAYGENSINQALADRRIEAENWPEDENNGFYSFQRRGDPSNKDRYVFFGFNLTKKFTGLRCNAF